MKMEFLLEALLNERENNTKSKFRYIFVKSMYKLLTRFKSGRGGQVVLLPFYIPYSEIGEIRCCAIRLCKAPNVYAKLGCYDTMMVDEIIEKMKRFLDN